MSSDDPDEPALQPFALPRSALFGFKDIDREHQELVDIINDAMVDLQRPERPPNRHFMARIAELRECMVVHFANEEREMRDAGFDGLTAHLTHHTQMIVRLNRMHAAAQLDAPINRETLFGLFDHVLDDVLRADLPFKDFLAARGLIRRD